MTPEFRQVLANWIRQAESAIGRFDEGADPAHWIAAQFGAWWSARVEDALTDAEAAADRACRELERIADLAKYDEVTHELTHLRDALGDLRSALGTNS
jgi:hypothetical protein